MHRRYRLLKGFLPALVLAACVSSAGAAPEAYDAAKAKKLYVAKCAKCHKLYDPAGYDDEKWDHWMVKMRRKARLKDEQVTILTRYLDDMRREVRGKR